MEVSWPEREALTQNAKLAHATKVLAGAPSALPLHLLLAFHPGPTQQCQPVRSTGKKNTRSESAGKLLRRVCYWHAVLANHVIVMQRSLIYLWDRPRAQAEAPQQQPASGPGRRLIDGTQQTLHEALHDMPCGLFLVFWAARGIHLHSFFWRRMWWSRKHCLQGLRPPCRASPTVVLDLR